MFILAINTATAITLKFAITNVAKMKDVVDDVKVKSALLHTAEKLRVRYRIIQIDADDISNKCRPFSDSTDNGKGWDENDEIVKINYDPFSSERILWDLYDAHQLIPPLKVPAAIALFRDEDCNLPAAWQAISYPFPDLIIALRPYTPLLNAYTQDQVAYLYHTIVESNAETTETDSFYIPDLRFRAYKIWYKEDLDNFEKNMDKTREDPSILTIFGDYVEKSSRAIRNSVWKPPPPRELYPNFKYKTGYPPPINLDDDKVKLAELGKHTLALGGWRGDPSLSEEFKDFLKPKLEKAEEDNEPLNRLSQVVLANYHDGDVPAGPLTGGNLLISDNMPSPELRPLKELSSPRFGNRLDEPQTPNFPQENLQLQLQVDKQDDESSYQPNKLEDIPSTQPDTNLKIASDKRPPRARPAENTFKKSAGKSKNNHESSIIRLHPVEYSPNRNFYKNQKQDIPQIQYSPQNDRFGGQKEDNNQVVRDKDGGGGGLIAPGIGMGMTRQKGAMRQGFRSKDQMQDAGLFGDGNKDEDKGKEGEKQMVDKVVGVGSGKSVGNGDVVKQSKDDNEQ